MSSHLASNKKLGEHATEGCRVERVGGNLLEGINEEGEGEGESDLRATVVAWIGGHGHNALNPLAQEAA